MTAQQPLLQARSRGFESVGPGPMPAARWLLALISVAAGAAAAPGSWTAQATAKDPAREPSVASLAAALESPDPRARREAAFQLFFLGRRALPALAGLRRVLADPDEEVRRMAALCLIRAGDLDPATLRVFVKALEQVQGTQFGEMALEDSSALLARFRRTACLGRCPVYTLYVMSDGTVFYRGWQHVKVEGVRSRRLTAVERKALVGAFDEAGYSSFHDRYFGGGTDAPSIEIKFAHEGQVKQVAHYLGDPGPKPLQRLEQRFEEIVRSLEWVGTEAERDALEQRKEEAARAAQLGRVPELLAALQDPKPERRRQAAAELLSVASQVADPNRGEWRRAASRVLAEAVRDPRESVRFEAVGALRGGGTLAPEAVEALVKCLEDPSARVRENASWALYEVGPAAKSAVPILVAQLPSSFFKERHLAAVVLGRIGPAAAPAVPALARALRDPDSRIRGAAASALSHIGPAAAAATGPLAETLRSDSDAGIRRLAAWALWQIGPPAAAAIPALEAALADPSPAVRAEATSALEAIRRP